MEYNINHMYFEGVDVIYYPYSADPENHLRLWAGFGPFVQPYCQEWPGIFGGLSECLRRRLGGCVGQHSNPHGIAVIPRGLYKK